MNVKITELHARDVRFPTSDGLHGSDAVNVDPDYSAAYVVLRTDEAGLEGHGLSFTTGRGTDVVVAAVRAYAHVVVGRSLSSVVDDMAGFWRSLTNESQLRWLGPEKGVVHLAVGAIVNAVWDLRAAGAAQPLWRLLLSMTPEELVACLNFSYVTDAITPEEAIEILHRNRATRGVRERELLSSGYPAYTTSAAWLGYDDDVVRQACRDRIAQGWTAFKMKVGARPDDDVRRAAVIRDEIGADRKLMMDANQKWDVDEAIAAMRRLAAFEPWWIEEPTAPDDVLGHARIRTAVSPVGVATGEHAHNRVLFKQLMQAEAIDFCQLDMCRLAGLNEALVVLLMAAKFGVPVCPHAGGLGLPEYVQHLSLFDYVAVSASLENRVLEHVDHLHEHFVDPVVLRDARYVPPTAAGCGVRIRDDVLDRYAFPHGEAWRRRRGGNSRR